MRRPITALALSISMLAALAPTAGATSSQGPYQYCPTGGGKVVVASQGPYQLAGTSTNAYCPR